MIIDGKRVQSIWLDDNESLFVIDQRLLPHKFEIVELKTWQEAADAIKNMVVRGAPLIGVTAAYSIYIAIKQFVDEAKPNQDFDEYLRTVSNCLIQTRPTAVNLQWGINKMLNGIKNIDTVQNKLTTAKSIAVQIENDDIETCLQIGKNGVKLIENIAVKKAKINIMTHCNAGSLATVDYGTALAPIYVAYEKGIDIHVWVSETRPRNQGAALTAFELGKAGVKHTLVVDNACGHLMQNGQVDIIIVGADRIARNGDTANKIGTYLKALSAKENQIPFYVAAPLSTIDFSIASGQDIIIEERDENEVLYMPTNYENPNALQSIAPLATKVKNYGFDVTPAKFIDGIITEKGICSAQQIVLP